jgi:hypothetical protein
MSCCGEARRQATYPPTIPSSRTASVTPPTVQPDRMAQLKYLGATPIVLTGPGSGRTYHIRTGERQVSADVRDAAAFLATGRFKQA